MHIKEVEYIDIHSHINDAAFDDDREGVIARMKEAGVGTILVGTHIDSSRKAIALAEKDSAMVATVGLHPTDTNEVFDETAYRELLEDDNVVGIGECGLDYFHGEDTDRERQRQKKAFESQLELAVEADKPLMIHCRQAHEDILSILESKKKEHGDRLRGDIHFFTGDKQTARRYFDLNFTISFTGVVTFTTDYDEVARYAPADMIQIETDAPYVAPKPHRGRRNEPSLVPLVAQRLAEIRGLELEQLKAQLRDNTQRVFGPFA